MSRAARASSPPSPPAPSGRANSRCAARAARRRPAPPGSWPPWRLPDSATGTTSSCGSDCSATTTCASGARSASASPSAASDSPTVPCPRSATASCTCSDACTGAAPRPLGPLCGTATPCISTPPASKAAAGCSCASTAGAGGCCTPSAYARRTPPNCSPPCRQRSTTSARRWPSCATWAAPWPRPSPPAGLPPHPSWCATSTSLPPSEAACWTPTMPHCGATWPAGRCAAACATCCAAHAGRDSPRAAPNAGRTWRPCCTGPWKATAGGSSGLPSDCPTWTSTGAAGSLASAPASACRNRAPAPSAASCSGPRMCSSPFGRAPSA